MYPRTVNRIPPPRYHNEPRKCPKPAKDYTSYPEPKLKGDCQYEISTYERYVTNRIDLSLRFGILTYGRIKFNISSFRKRRGNNSACCIRSGGLKINTQLMTTPYPSRVTVELSVGEGYMAPKICYHFNMIADYSKSNLDNPNLENYIYYEPEFEWLDITSADIDTIEIMYRAYNLNLLPPVICPLVETESPLVFYLENHQLQDGDRLEACNGSIYTVTVVDDDRFTIDSQTPFDSYVVLERDVIYSLEVIGNETRLC